MRRAGAVLGLSLFLVALAHPLAGAASDVWGNVGPASPLGAGGLYGRYPLGNYALDQHFDAISASLTGGVDASGVAPMIAYFLTSVLWALTSFLANLLIELFAFAFSLDLLTGSEATGGSGALAPVARAIHSIYANVFGAPWLVLAVAVTGLWAMWRALVQRRYAETAGALGLSLIYVVAAFFFVAQPAKTIGTASAWTNKMSQSFLAVASHGNPSGGARARDGAAQQLFDLLVFRPWVVLEFGGTEHCARAGTGDEGSDPDSVAVRPLSPDPGRDAALARRLRAGEEVSGDGKLCINNAAKYAHRFLRFGPGTDERDAEYDALNHGDASRASDGARGYRLGVADKPATDAMEEGGQYQRLLVAIVVFISELGAFCLLGALSVGVILAQVLLLLLLAFAPVALVAAAIPGRGHTFFRGWLEKLAGYLLRKAAYSLILAVLLAVNGALAVATSGLGWLMSFGLQGLFFWAVFLQRETLTQSLIGIATGPRAPGRDASLRLLSLYAGGRMAGQASRSLGRGARTAARAPGRVWRKVRGGRSGRAPRFGTHYSAPVGGGYPSMDAADPSVASEAAAAGEGQGRPERAPAPPESRPLRRPLSPSAGQTVLIRGRVHTVRSVDRDGGLHTRFTPDDGSGPTSHYWSPGTEWTPSPSPGQTVAIRGRRHMVRSVDPDGGLHTRFNPDDGSGATSHYWAPGTEWSGTEEGASSASEQAGGDRDLSAELRAEREGSRPAQGRPDPETPRVAPSAPRRRRRWRRKGQQ